MHKNKYLPIHEGHDPMLDSPFEKKVYYTLYRLRTNLPWGDSFPFIILLILYFFIFMVSSNMIDPENLNIRARLLINGINNIIDILINGRSPNYINVA